MTPKLLFSLIAGIIVAVLVYTFSDELFSTLLDKQTQNDLGELLGVTKQGSERPGD